MSQVTEVSITPTITAGAYSQGDVVGGLMTFSIPWGGQSSAILNRVLVTDQAAQTADLRLHFYDAAPTTIADNAAWSRSDADLLLWIYSVDITTFVAGAANSVALVDGIDAELVAPNGALWMYLEVTDATPPTFAATDDLALTLYLSGTQ